MSLGGEHHYVWDKEKQQVEVGAHYLRDEPWFWPLVAGILGVLLGGVFL